MRKFLIGLGVVVALAIPASAVAVDLHTPHVGTTCEFGGTFHFVANGVDGKVGKLTASFSGGGGVQDQVSFKYNQGTNHWTIDGIGRLDSASATVGKKLVLSDYTCREKKHEK